jgi:hypothetical protein
MGRSGSQIAPPEAPRTKPSEMELAVAAAYLATTYPNDVAKN